MCKPPHARQNGWCGGSSNVRFWPIADIRYCTAHVRFWGQSGHRSNISQMPAFTQSGHCPTLLSWKTILRCSRRDDHDLAKGLAFGQQPDRFDAALEGESVSNAWLEPAASMPRKQYLHRLLELIGRVVPEVAQRAAERGAVLHEQPVRWNLLDPTHEADKEHPPTPSEAGECVIGQLSADRVEANVGTLAIR